MSSQRLMWDWIGLDGVCRGMLRPSLVLSNITPKVKNIFQAKYKVSLCRTISLIFSSYFLCSFVNFMLRFMGLIPRLQVSNLVNSGNFLI